MFRLRSTRLRALLLPLLLAACSDNDATGPDETLGIPSGVTAATTTQNSITVQWNAATNAVSYVVERASGGGYTQVATATTTTYQDGNLLPDTEYRYRIAAVRGTDKSSFSTELLARTAVAGPKVATIEADISTSRTLYADTVYTLRGFIHVNTGATLTIQPGTKILGDYNTLGSSLFIMRGAKIEANGTADKPIVFTSSRPENQRQPGDWGGLILVGNGIINRTGTITIEGTGTNATTNPAITYSGGTNNADNSGTLRYVRVEFAGYATAADQELNSFTFAAVGSGTTLEYLQSLAGLDDAFEWFGGAVDGKYLVSYESGDDHFDMSEGYAGRLQYVIAYQSKVLTPRPGAGAVSSDPQGIENDGCSGAGCGAGQLSTPYTTPLVANFTLIGTGAGHVDATSGGLGMVLRRGTAGMYINGVVARWPKGGVSIRDTVNTNQLIRSGELQVRNVYLSDNAGIAFQAGTDRASFDLAANGLVAGNATAASLFSALPTDPSPGSQFDWSPSPNSPVRTGGLATLTGTIATRAGTFVTGTGYVGAADPAGAKWWQGWTNYADN